MKIPDPKKEIAELKAEQEAQSPSQKRRRTSATIQRDHSARRQTAGSKSTQENAKKAQHSTSEMNSPT
jgi:hypothetical protein